MMESAVVANALQDTTSVEEGLTLVCIQAEQEDCFSHIMVPNLLTLIVVPCYIMYSLCSTFIEEIS